MKNLSVALCLVLTISSCSNSDRVIVNSSFVDSLVTHYSPSPMARTMDSNLAFWENRMDSLPDNFVNGPEYASALSSRFHLYGDINDLLKADSLVKRSSEANQEKEPGILRTLANLAMLHHRFQAADSFLQKAIKIEGRSLPNIFTDFDIAFERGQYKKAQQLLHSLKTGNSYGYLFRRAKLEHYNGSLDSAIACMIQAAQKAGTNNYLKQVALSNAADLYLHKGNPGESYKLYMECIRIDAADFHSIMGIGWIALVRDKNDTLAKKIFEFVRRQQHSPDALLRLLYVAEVKSDTGMQKKYAREFARLASDSKYGMMYSKYLIDLYTSVLDQPSIAVELAEKEIANRPTPQVLAWHAWSLYRNNEKEKAHAVFKNAISGMPLEGLELCYMGQMMEGLNKGYNAKEFFKAAYKNRFDLSPAKQKYIEERLQ